MPTEEAVLRYADMILARGERPSLRKLREEIPSGNSPREVCKHLRAWRKKRGYNPKLEPRSGRDGPPASFNRYFKGRAEGRYARRAG